MLELQVHGSPVVAREIVRALLACGARLAQPGEFTRRAFLNGKMDLHAAEAVADVIEAETRAAARAALANLGGGARRPRSGASRQRAGTLLEELAGAIDFPDEVARTRPRRLESRSSQLSPPRSSACARRRARTARARRRHGRDRRAAQRRQVVAAQRVARRRTRDRFGDRRERRATRSRRRSSSTACRCGSSIRPEFAPTPIGWSAPASSARAARWRRRGIALVVIDGSQPLGAERARCWTRRATARALSSSTRPISATPARRDPQRPAASRRHLEPGAIDRAAGGGDERRLRVRSAASAARVRALRGARASRAPRELVRAILGTQPHFSLGHVSEP